MKFISETIIDEVIEQLADSPEAYTLEVEALQARHPVIMGYLFSETFRMLSQEEREFMLYLAIVVLMSIEKGESQLAAVKEDSLEEAEDKNWEIFQEAKGSTFRDKLNVFFENTPQEDLLAFLEDSLEDDDEQPISNEGKELIFVSLKSVIDSLGNRKM